MKQVQRAIVMGLGPALREETIFKDAQIQNASIRKYQVPRFDDVPELDIQLLNCPDLASAGAGETPIIAVAPAIANAVFQHPASAFGPCRSASPAERKRNRIRHRPPSFR